MEQDVTCGHPQCDQKIGRTEQYAVCCNASCNKSYHLNCIELAAAPCTASVCSSNCLAFYQTNQLCAACSSGFEVNDRISRCISCNNQGHSGECAKSLIWKCSVCDMKSQSTSSCVKCSLAINEESEYACFKCDTSYHYESALGCFVCSPGECMIFKDERKDEEGLVKKYQEEEEKRDASITDLQAISAIMVEPERSEGRHYNSGGCLNLSNESVESFISSFINHRSPIEVMDDKVSRGSRHAQFSVISSSLRGANNSCARNRQVPCELMGTLALNKLCSCKSSRRFAFESDHSTSKLKRESRADEIHHRGSVDVANCERAAMEDDGDHCERCIALCHHPRKSGHYECDACTITRTQRGHAKELERRDAEIAKLKSRASVIEAENKVLKSHVANEQSEKKTLERRITTLKLLLDQILEKATGELQACHKLLQLREGQFQVFEKGKAPEVTVNQDVDMGKRNLIEQSPVECPALVSSASYPVGRAFDVGGESQSFEVQVGQRLSQLPLLNSLCDPRIKQFRVAVINSLCILAEPDRTQALYDQSLLFIIEKRLGVPHNSIWKLRKSFIESREGRKASIVDLDIYLESYYDPCMESTEDYAIKPPSNQVKRC